MKKLFLLFFSLVTIGGFADTITLNNQTPYPSKSSKMAIQWASSAQEVNDGNTALMHGTALNPTTFQMITQPKKAVLTIPKNAEYFRILVWTKETENPDLHTNWLTVTPNKTYHLKTDKLIPTVLASGMGC